MYSGAVFKRRHLPAMWCQYILFSWTKCVFSVCSRHGVVGRSGVHCPGGKYQPSAGIATACLDCPSFAPWSGVTPRSTTVISGVGEQQQGATSVDGCVCVDGMEKYPLGDAAISPICLCGPGKFMQSEDVPTCTLAGENTFQPSDHRTLDETDSLTYDGVQLTDVHWNSWSAELACPIGSEAPEESDALEDCTCINNQDKVALAAREAYEWQWPGFTSWSGNSLLAAGLIKSVTLGSVAAMDLPVLRLVARSENMESSRRLMCSSGVRSKAIAHVRWVQILYTPLMSNLSDLYLTLRDVKRNVKQMQALVTQFNWDILLTSLPVIYV